MKKTIKYSVVMAGLLAILGIQTSFAGETTSKAYHMSVTIPEIVGANVPHPSTPQETLTSAQLASNFNTNEPIVEERFVNNQRVVYESIVMK